MVIDICLPENNEKQLIARAKELGIKQLVFLYPLKSKKEISEKKLEIERTMLGVKSNYIPPTPNHKSSVNIYVGVYLKPKKAQIKISNQLYLEADLIAVSSQNEAVIRAAVSNPKIDLVFGVPSSAGRDHPAYRRSNFNEILANLAKKNKVRYAIDFSALLESEGVARAKLWGREAQNVRLCRRKLPIIIASFARNNWQPRNPNDLAAIAQILGLNAPQSKKAVSTNLFSIWKEKQIRRSKQFIAPGIKLVK